MSFANLNTKEIIKRDKTFNYLLILMFLIAILSMANYFKDDIMSFYKVSYRKIYGKLMSDKDLEDLKKGLNIKEIDYKWEEPLSYVNQPREIIYHHAASSEWSPEAIHEYHKGKGWSGIGYHYYIRKDGTIYSGRPETAEGAHTIGKNKESIGICLEGNFEEETLTREQLDSLYKLSIYEALKYDIYKIEGHRDVYNTLCPGKNFPVEKMRKNVIKGIESYDINKNIIESEFDEVDIG